MGRRHGPRGFDPTAVANFETDAWVAYYRREWARFLRSAVGMVRAGFGMGRLKTWRGAWLVLRANQKWAPYPANDPDAARRSMQRFYRLVAADTAELRLNPARAAWLEVEWWRLHRARQHDPAVPREELVQSLVNLYRYVYGAEPESVLPAADARVEAMDLSDAWVAAGCGADDPRLVAERRSLVASYTALRAAVQQPG